jgi:hypothetical protein
MAKNLHPRLCEDVYARLPLGVREMVYEHIGVVHDHLPPFFRTAREEQEFPNHCLRIFANIWFFDPDVVGQDLVR